MLEGSVKIQSGLGVPMGAGVTSKPSVPPKLPPFLQGIVFFLLPLSYYICSKTGCSGRLQEFRKKWTSIAPHISESL